MDMLLTGQLMASGYWGLGSNSCFVSFDQLSVFVCPLLKPRKAGNMWAKLESPCVPPETLETDGHMVNALKVKAVGSKSKY